MGCYLYFPATPLEFSCSVIHLIASYSVIKPLITSVSPSGHRISTPQPDPGFFRATKVGRCSDILRICAYGGPVQASYPATIKLTNYLRSGSLRLDSSSPSAAGGSFVPLQLPLAPMRLFSIGVEHALDAVVHRPQRAKPASKIISPWLFPEASQTYRVFWHCE
jgi:hypothetical protein